MSFPLYDSLVKGLPEVKKITIKQKTEFISKLKKLEKGSVELTYVYLLIRFFHMKNTSETESVTLPYEGKREDDYMEFSLDKFPIQLFQILSKFLTMHFEKIDNPDQFR